MELFMKKTNKINLVYKIEKHLFLNKENKKSFTNNNILQNKCHT